MNRTLLSSVSALCLALTLTGCPGGPQPDPEICERTPDTEPFANDSSINPMTILPHTTVASPDGRIGILANDTANTNMLRLRIWDGFEWITAPVTPSDATLVPGRPPQLATYGDRFLVVAAYSTPSSTAKFHALTETAEGQFEDSPSEGNLPSPIDHILTRTIAEPYLDRAIILLKSNSGYATFVEKGEDGRLRMSHITTSALVGEPIAGGYDNDLIPWMFIYTTNPTSKFFLVKRVGTTWVDGGYSRSVFGSTWYPFAVATPFGSAGGRLLVWGYSERSLSSSVPEIARINVQDLEAGTSLNLSEFGRSSSQGDPLLIALGFSEDGSKVRAFAQDQDTKTAFYRTWTAGEGPSPFSAAEPYRSDLAILRAPIPIEACGRELILTQNVPVGTVSAAPLRLEPMPE